MPHNTNKSELPPSNLGDDRCFQIEYFGQGDIFAAVWEGDIDHEPTVEDGVSTCFNFAHGSDVVIMASLAGYLRRIGKPQEEVKGVLREAGQEILADDSLRPMYRNSMDEWSNARVAEGRRMPRFDIAEPELHCLVIPIPSQPEDIRAVGGTGIYTRPNKSGDDSYVLAHIKGRSGSKLTDPDQIGHLADFQASDVPVMAKLVCEMSLGEYRRDIQAFLSGLYTQPDDAI